MNGNAGSFADKTRQGFDKDVFEILTRQSLNENDLTVIRGLEGLCNKHESILLSGG